MKYILANTFMIVLILNLILSSSILSPTSNAYASILLPFTGNDVSSQVRDANNTNNLPQEGNDERVRLALDNSECKDCIHMYKGSEDLVEILAFYWFIIRLLLMPRIIDLDN